MLGWEHSQAAEPWRIRRAWRGRTAAGDALGPGPIACGCGLLLLLALDVRAHIVIPILQAYGHRWARRAGRVPAKCLRAPSDRVERYRLVLVVYERLDRGSAGVGRLAGRGSVDGRGGVGDRLRHWRQPVGQAPSPPRRCHARAVRCRRRGSRNGISSMNFGLIVTGRQGHGWWRPPPACRG